MSRYSGPLVQMVVGGAFGGATAYYLATSLSGASRLGIFVIVFVCGLAGQKMGAAAKELWECWRS